jgi:hypothetical protein
MNYRELLIPGFILLAAIQYISTAIAAPEASPNIYKIELIDLKKRGECDSTKYTVTNLDSQSTITSHYFLNKQGQEVYTFTSSAIDPGEARTYDLNDMDALPPYFIGDVLIASTGEISGQILPFPPCGISITCTPELQFAAEIFKTYVCTATVTPEDLLQPLTITWYEWDAQQQEYRVIGIGEEVVLSWSTGGFHQFFITARNPVGIITVSNLVYVNGSAFYIPVTIK